MCFLDFHENLYFHENSSKTFGQNFSKFTLFLKQLGGRGGIEGGKCETSGQPPLTKPKKLKKKNWDH